MLLQVFSLFCLLFNISDTIQVAPTWITSPYVQAASAKLINGIQTGNSSSPTVTMAFTTAFTAVPNLGYGIIRYEGSDFMASEMLQVKRVSLTTTSFTVRMQISGVTNLWFLYARYIAIDDAFPHHLNSFDNVPINYTRGPITNISSFNNVTVWYANTINYTKQATNAGYIYRSFTGSFSNYKIVLFMTSLFHYGKNQFPGQTLRPLNLQVASRILSKQTYMLNATYGIKAHIIRLHFSIIIFDQANVQSTKTYFLVYQKINFGSAGGFIAVPQQFVPNLMVGFAQYAAQRTLSMIHYEIRFQFNPSAPSTYGIYMPASIPRYNAKPFTRLTFSILYLKTWVCPTDTFFNITLDLCESCPILNCIVCQKIDLCKTCKSGYILNPQGNISQQCLLSCPITGCLKCQDQNKCTLCNQALNYILQQDSCYFCDIPNCLTCLKLSQCQICNEKDGYFLTQARQCSLCTIPNCLQCMNLMTCSVCDEANNYFFNITQTISDLQCTPCTIPRCTKCLDLYQCSICETGYVLNSKGLVNEQCILCPIPNCLQCINSTACRLCDEFNLYILTTKTNIAEQCSLCSIPNCLQCISQLECGSCNQSNNYFPNPTPTNLTDICIICTLPGCVLCATPYACLVCNEQLYYFLDQSPNSTYQCLECNITQCVVCSNLTECMICNSSNNYFLNITDLQCVFCELPNCNICSSLTTCMICNNSYYLNAATKLCQEPPPVCGDNIYLPPQQCDDGNNKDGDGCSSTCTLEADFTCEPNPDIFMFNSLCYYIGTIQVTVVYIEKVDFSNQIEILLSVSPNNLFFWDTVDFTSMITLSNIDIFDSYQVKRNSDGTVAILVNYNTDIQNMEITVNFDPALSGNIVLQKADPVSKTFQIVPNDNEAALFYDQNVYERAQIISYLAYGIAAAYLLFFIIGLFAGKLVGVQMMAVIQISYLSLITLSSINPCFNALSNIWFVNGFNYFSLFKGHLRDSDTPLEVKGINLYSRFLKNYNLTILLMLTPFLVGLICLIISMVIQKSKKITSHNLQKFGKKLMCQYVFNGIMFSGYIIATSISIEIAYGFAQIKQIISLLGIVEIVVLGLLIIAYFVLIILKGQYFGQFIDYFKIKPKEKKHDKPSQDTEKKNQESKSIQPEGQSLGTKNECLLNHKWYNILMIQRMLVGSSLIFLLQVQLSPLFTIGVFVLLSIYTLIRKPYLQYIHNIRFICNMIICIIIQAIYLTYKMTKTNKQSRQSGLLFPIIVCVLLIICLVYNIAILVMQLIKQKKAKQYDQTFQQQQMGKFFIEIEKQSIGKIDRALGSSPGSSGRNLTAQLNQIKKKIKIDFGLKKLKLIDSDQQNLNRNEQSYQI